MSQTANPPLPKACVILGAGASRDVRNEGSPIINAAFQPPLAKDLFDIEHHPDYWTILQNYPGAAALAQLLAPKAASGAEPIEQELRKLAEHHDPTMRSHFREIPAYLRDLLTRVSRNYTHRPSCYIQLVVELLAETPHDILFLVLNYDDFLEQALTAYRPQWTFDNMERYVADERPKLVKLHGSIDWFRRIGYPDRPWHQLVLEVDVSERIPDGEIMVYNSPNSVVLPEPSGYLLYPLLTAPVAGKSAGAFVCPRQHIEVAQSFLRTCNKFLIVGTSGLDNDLLELLDSSIPPESHPFVRWVDQGHAQEVLQRFVHGVRAFRARAATTAERFDREQPFFDNGFKNYVTGDGLKKFAKIVYGSSTA